MSTQSRYLIKFKQGDLACLRASILEDLSREHFAVLLGKTQKIDGYMLINVIDLLFPGRSDYNQQNVAFLRIKKDFIHKSLVELTNRYDVDTIIDVHTHPFSQGSVSFSATDDGDEKTFFCFKNRKNVFSSPSSVAENETLPWENGCVWTSIMVSTSYLLVSSTNDLWMKSFLIRKKATFC